AHQKPRTEKPSRKFAASQNRKPLITKVNSPSVRMFTGSVRIRSTGRISAFSSESTSAATSAAPKLRTCTAGISQARASRLTALMIQATMSDSMGVLRSCSTAREAAGARPAGAASLHEQHGNAGDLAHAARDGADQQIAQPRAAFRAEDHHREAVGVGRLRDVVGDRSHPEEAVVRVVQSSQQLARAADMLR